MTYSTLTLEQSIDLARNEIRNRIPGADVSRGSDYDILARVLGTMFFGTQAQGEYLSRQALPDTAELTYLERHAAIRGIYRQLAAGSTGSVMLLGTGAGPYVQPVNSVLEHADGTQFELTAPATVYTPTWSGKTLVTGSTRSRVLVAPNTAGMAAGDVVDIGGEKIVIGELVALASAFDTLTPINTTSAPGTAITPASGTIASVRSLSTGATTSKPAVDVLTLAAPTAGISASATVLLLSGAGDQESDDEIRARTLDHTAVPPGGGNVEDFRTWARTTLGVRLGDAFVFPNRRGLGTVDVYPVGIAGARPPSASMLAAVTAQIALKTPALLDVLVKSFTYSAEIDVTVQIVAGAEWASDFGITSYTVSGGSTASRINTSASFIGLAEIGDHVVLQCVIGGLRYAFQRTIASITAAYFDLDSPLPAVPVSGQTIRSGGPLWQTAYDAIVDIFENLGPGSAAGGVGYIRHPAPVDAFPETLYLASIVRAVQSIHGVSNCVVTDPALDTTAALGEILRRGKIDLICV
jgi:uncharacterized phage protein gp47/JayE